MFLPPRRSRSEDAQTHHLFHYTLYPKLARSLVLILVVCTIGSFCYPYLNLWLYPYVVFATIPTPDTTSQILRDSELSTACHTSSILRVYRTDRPFEEIKSFYTSYIREQSVWTLIDEGNSADPTRPDYWLSERHLLGWDTSNQSLTLRLSRFDNEMYPNYMGDLARQALREGKTVYILVVGYVADFKQNRVAVRDPTSKCFTD